MKYYQFLLFVLLLSLGISACQNLIDDGEIVTDKSPVVAISSTNISGNKVSFIVKASWYNGCGSFSHFTSSQTDSTFYITVYGRQPKYATCTQAFIEYDAPVDITIAGLGKYKFKFWQSDTTSVDTTITF